MAAKVFNAAKKAHGSLAAWGDNNKALGSAEAGGSTAAQGKVE